MCYLTEKEKTRRQRRRALFAGILCLLSLLPQGFYLLHPLPCRCQGPSVKLQHSLAKP